MRKQLFKTRRKVKTKTKERIMSKKLKLLSIVFALILVFVACTPKTEDTNPPAEDNNEETETAEASIEIQGIESLEGGIEMITAEEIKTMEAQTITTTNISSSGEVVETEIKGVKINKILKKYDLRQDDFEGIRFFAGDGYSIVIPKEILETKDVMLYWEADGEPLDDKFQPLRVAVPDERSMYWVGQVAGMELIKGKEENMDKSSEGDMDSMALENPKIIFMEAAISTLESEDYTYYEATDQAVMTDSLLTSFGSKDANELFMEAVDDFTKTEKMDIFLTGYIKFTGEYAPLFLSPDLPKGMHVKNILMIKDGSTTFVTESQSFAKYADNLVTILEDECVPLAKIEELTGLAEGMNYTLTAADGYSKTIDRETFLKGGIYARNNGGYGISFEGMDKKAKIKDILSIEVVELDKNMDDNMSEESSDDAMMSDYILAIKVNGTDFTTEGTNIEFVTVNVEKMNKEGNLSPAEWSGYRVSDILAANGVEGSTVLTVTASDGYAIELDSETANLETTIFGFVQDGESIGDSAPRLVVNGEGNKIWISNIAELAAE
jgi:DMSO/TMAO reductase YedYZ molybdopterin-dependent catalytic subunit